MPINTLPKSFKLLSKSEKDEIFYKINGAALGIAMVTTRGQNAGACKSHAEDIIKLAKKLERCQVAEAFHLSLPAVFRATPIKTIHCKFGVTFTAGTPYDGTRSGTSFQLINTQGVRVVVDSRNIEYVQ